MSTRLNVLLLALTPVLSAVLAYAGIRLAAKSGSPDLSKLVDSVAFQMTLNTFGPIVGVGLAAAAIIACAILVPVMVTRALNSRKENP